MIPYYQDEFVKLYHGDCMDILPSLPDRSVSMILSDLPYGTTRNEWDTVLPLDELWSQYERVITANGVIALTAQGRFTAELIMSNSRLFKYKIVWVKSKPTNFLNAGKQPLRKHEDICIFYQGCATYRAQMTEGEAYNKGFRKDHSTGCYGEFKSVEVKSTGQRYPTDVVYFKTAESEGAVVHPAQKPLGLAKYLITTFTKAGDTVLDNACGSGTTLRAAKDLNCRAVGIEIEEKYCAITAKRMEQEVLPLGAPETGRGSADDGGPAVCNTFELVL